MSKMAISKIGYRGIGADGKPVDTYYGWNPGGFGCSMNCDGCWSKSMCFRASCPDCRAFKVHLHAERLSQPELTQKPGTVLVNFTCDTFDVHREMGDICRITSAMCDAPQHTHVMLTKQADRMEFARSYWGHHTNWFYGLTIRNQAEADAKLPPFLTIKDNLWLSLEPLRGPVDLTKPRGIKGVIAGHDNRRGAPGTDTLEHVRSVVQQCQAAGVPVYVKQLWLPRCTDCGWMEHGNATGLFGKRCRICSGMMKWKLEKEPEQFPPDLQLRNLPWSMPTVSE